MRLKWIGVTAGVLLVLGLIVFGVYWNEARKEVIYLCGNFSAGVARDSVIRQLDTGTFLRYAERPMTDGTRIVVDSRLTGGIYRCVIDLDRSGRVTRAWVGDEP